MLSARHAALTLGVLLVLRAPRPAVAADSFVPAVSAARELIAEAWEGRFPAGESKGREHFEERLRNLRRVHCLELAGIAMMRVALTADGADIAADVATWKRDRHSAGERVSLDVMPLRLHMRQGGDGRWLAASVDLLDEELADRLLAAAPEARAALLSANERRLTKELTHALGRRVREICATFVNELPRCEAAAQLEHEVAAILGDRGGEALSLVRRGIAALGRNDVAAATELSRTAISLGEAAGDADAIAWGWYLYAATLTRLDMQSPAVEDAYHHTLEFAEQAEDSVPESGSLHYLATLATIKGDMATARRLLRRVAPIVAYTVDVDDDIQWNMGLALIYEQQGDHELAMHHLRRCLSLGGTQFLRAQVLARMTDVLINGDRLDEAAKTLAEARAVVPPMSILNAFLLEQAGIIDARRGDLSEAECVMRQAAARFATRGFQYGPALHELTPRLAKAKNYTAVLQLSLEQASNIAERSPAVAAKVLTAASEAYAALGDRHRAVALLDEAIGNREALSEMTTAGEEERIRSSEAAAACYEMRAKLAADDGDIAAALAFVERGRGRVLYDRINSGRSSMHAAEEEQERVARSEKQVTRLAIEVSRAEASHDAGMETLRGRLAEAQRDHRSLLDDLRERSSRRTAAAHPLDAATLSDALAAMPPGMVAVEYVVRDDEIEAVVARRDGARTLIRPHVMRMERAAIERRVDAFLKMISIGDLRYRDVARNLHRLLIAPLDDDLRTAEAICIVPDEVLWRLPFAALLDDQNRFVVERWPLVYAPSIAVYASMALKPRDAVRPEPGVLLVANPTLGRELRENLAGLYAGISLGSLRDAEWEVEKVRDLYPPRASLLLEGGLATEGRVKTTIRGMHTVHFATHAILDDRHPMYSRLVLANGDGDGDGSLEAWEVARLSVPADLVVLSACDTARGAIAAGEGVVSMAWSFFVAGARSTVATQWKVGSRSAALLAVALHESLRARAADRSLRKARALRDAQLRLLRDPETRHPFHWAAFVLLGDAS